MIGKGDPACGSGNFLTETYLSIRRLENKVIEHLLKGMMVLEFANPVKVSIGQFAGIEINDFAVTVARTALWIAESQMIKETEAIVNQTIEFFPLKTNAKIIEGNALRMDWNDVISKYACSYIMGNPPFSGTKVMSKEAKADSKLVFEKWKNAGTLDYVACWYKKSCDYIEGTNIKVAFVSTNSISQGEQATYLWQPLFAKGIHIDFAYQTFIWESEAIDKAHVYCIIIGFSCTYKNNYKYLFTDDEKINVNNINAYLLDAPSVFIQNRKNPLCNVPQMHNGCKFLDDGNYIFRENELKDFLQYDPNAEKFIRPYIGAKTFINNIPVYCLWLQNANPTEIKKSRGTLERIEKVRNFRLSCSSPDTNKYADRPMLPTRLAYYSEPRNTDMLVIPIVTSERRKWLPIGYVDKNAIVSYSNMIIPEASLYIFGVMESNVHMAWVRTVCGRLESRYRYSNTIVYNNFPWPVPTEQQKKKIELTAQNILDTRAKYFDSSIADLYDPLTMPDDLRKAHQANDRAVMEAYGMWGKVKSESECVAWLFRMYEDLTKEK